MKRITALGFLMLSCSVYAGNTSTGPVTISNLDFYSKTESIYPYAAGLVAVHASGMSWSGGGTCGTTYAWVKEEDKNLVSALLAAYATSKQVLLYADDSVKNNGACYLRAIRM